MAPQGWINGTLGVRMSQISYQLKNDIAIIKLLRAEKRNAISDSMLSELEIAIKKANVEAKAAVIWGDGDHFCAGLDLSEHIDKTAIEGIAGSRRWHAIFTEIQRGTIPYFSALHGAVVGGGLELASATHVRVADESAFFALPEGQRGIFVGGGGSVNISRVLGVSRMIDLMLTGRVLSSSEAERFNIVSYITPKGGAFEKALELAKCAAKNSALSNYCIINAIPRIHDSGYDEGLFFESMIASFTQESPDAKMRLKAFLDKKAARLAVPNEVQSEASFNKGN